MLALLASLALTATIEAPTRVDEVRVSGLWFSTEATVLRELPFAVGEVVEPARWQLFITRLWNLGVFSRVDVHLEAQPDGRHVAMVDLEDRFPIGPVIRANFGGGQFFIWAGAADINLFGRALEVRAFYERFGTQNGFHVHVMDPRFLDRRITALLEGEWLARVQPTLIARRAAVRASVDFSPAGFDDDLLRLGARAEGNSDELTAPGPAELALPPNSRALSAGLFLRFGRLDTERLRFVRGFLEVHGDVGASSDPSATAFQLLTLEAQYFWLFGERLNLATRLLAGVEAGARPQDRPLVGGLTQVRGYYYAEVRARAYAVANVELRVVGFDSTWFAAMGVVFADGALTQRDTGELQPLASVGAGLRLMVPRLPRFGGRLEVAFPMVGAPALGGSPGSPAWRPGISFGVWHFF